MNFILQNYTVHLYVKIKYNILASDFFGVVNSVRIKHKNKKFNYYKYCRHDSNEIFRCCQFPVDNRGESPHCSHASCYLSLLFRCTIIVDPNCSCYPHRRRYYNCLSLCSPYLHHHCIIEEDIWSIVARRVILRLQFIHIFRDNSYV